MDSSITGLRRLLAGELPLDGVGPQLRDDARRALRAGDEGRLRAVARAAVGELLRSGRLLRVAVDAGSGHAPGPYCLLRGTSRLIDLSPLGKMDPAAVESAPLVPSLGAQELGEMAGMLGAMEFAQDLESADTRTADKASILVGVIRLLERFVPQFALHIQLLPSDLQTEGNQGVFSMKAADREQGWQPLRPAGHSVWISTGSELPAAVRAEHERTRGEPPVCGVAVPLWEPEAASNVQGHGIEAGLLYLTASQDWGREPLLRLAERLSRFVTRRWHTQREVNLRIHKDGLTGVFNRAFFDSQFPLELERARRSQGPLTLVMIDLDHFKAVNDNHGHQAGDRVLKMLARRLQEELRRIDHVCRVGGEEFALILPETPFEAAQEVVARLLEAEYCETIQAGGDPIPLRVTFSAGAVTFPAAGLDPFELYRKADAMLYLSKDLGRSQCHFWDSEGNHLRIQPRER